MRKKKTLKKYIGIWAVCLLALLCMPGTIWAADGIQTEKTGRLTITYPFDSASFALYRTAEASEGGAYQWTKDFRGYSVSLSQNSEEEWKAAAGKLAAYVKRDKPKPYRKGVTDKQGTLVFDGLETGLYLVMGEPGKSEFEEYTSLPFLIQLPGLNENREWEYEITAAPKYEKNRDQLPDGGMKDPPSDKNTSSGGNTPGSGGSSGKLPQTGQLWWPVPLLLICGMLFLAAGLWIQKKRK